MLDADRKAARYRKKRAWLEAARADPVKREAMRLAANASAKKSRDKNRAKIREAQRAKRSDPEYRAKEVAYTRAWYEANREQLAAARKARREDPVLRTIDKAKRERNRARKAELDRVLRQDSEWLAKKRAYQAAWDADPVNRARRNQRQATARKERPHLRVQQNTRNLIGEMIRQGSKGALRHLPYTIAQLCAHIEKQFARGMTWENYGSGWHIDHILPIASFKVDATDPAKCLEFQACWALSNLRPLWTMANISKGSARLHLL
jgi:hypothetical protein